MHDNNVVLSIPRSFLNVWGDTERKVRSCWLPGLGRRVQYISGLKSTTVSALYVTVSRAIYTAQRQLLFGAPELQQKLILNSRVRHSRYGHD